MGETESMKKRRLQDEAYRKEHLPLVKDYIENNYFPNVKNLWIETFLFVRDNTKFSIANLILRKLIEDIGDNAINYSQVDIIKEYKIKIRPLLNRNEIKYNKTVHICIAITDYMMRDILSEFNLSQDAKHKKIREKCREFSYTIIDTTTLNRMPTKKDHLIGVTGIIKEVLNFIGDRNYKGDWEYRYISNESSKNRPDLIHIIESEYSLKHIDGIKKIKSDVKLYKELFSPDLKENMLYSNRELFLECIYALYNNISSTINYVSKKTTPTILYGSTSNKTSRTIQNNSKDFDNNQYTKGLTYSRYINIAKGLDRKTELARGGIIDNIFPIYNEDEHQSFHLQIKEIDQVNYPIIQTYLTADQSIHVNLIREKITNYKLDESSILSREQSNEELSKIEDTIVGKFQKPNEHL